MLSLTRVYALQNSSIRGMLSSSSSNFEASRRHVTAIASIEWLSKMRLTKIVSDIEFETPAKRFRSSKNLSMYSIER